MKTRMVSLFVGSLLGLSTIDLFANGIVNFSNAGVGPEYRIYHGGWVWLGGNNYQFTSMQPCTGPNFYAALYSGAAGAPAAAMIQFGPAVSFLSTTDGAGMFVGGNRTISHPESGPVLSFQVRAWSHLPGVPNTYEAVGAAGMAGDPRATFGAGPIFQMDTKDPLNAVEPAPVIGQDPGWRGFLFGPDGLTVVLVPEPSTWALSALGAATAFLMFRRTRPRSD